ncbi:MAG: 16S rRNA (adenine(1518)-N(6)/adenine(1519)-N(6))-dimethyltransferase RsmA [Thermoplasmata archaeon]|nr:16S rRNA (adenine(1518)-N(6)/adenine(1519)-N(6))-dimethyltransferase RsmA [Thermoplasmata archaeon]
MPRTSTGSSSPRKPAVRPGETPGVPRDPEAVRTTLHRIGVRPSRRFGQSFLVNDHIADIEAALVELPHDAPITEIGGGLGLLTDALLRRGYEELRVLERDRRLAAHLQATFGQRVRVEIADARVADYSNDAAVVGNLPFSVATPILLRLLRAGTPRIVALVQREVGARFAGVPGTSAYGRPSVVAAAYAQVEAFAPVPSRDFFPPPLVDGLVIRSTARSDPFPAESAERLEEVLRVLFSTRRKQLRNVLPRLTAGDRAAAARLAEEANWPADWADRRAEELPPDAFFAISRLPPRGTHGSVPR